MERPEIPGTLNDSVFAWIKDVKGAELNLFTYHSICKEYYDGLGYQGNLPKIFEYQNVLPIEKLNGMTALYNIENLDEYHFDGTNAVIILKNGQRIEGKPVKDYEISGRSVFGNITLPMENINFAKFNMILPGVADDMAREPIKQYLYFDDGHSYYWPDDYKGEISIITQTGDQETIESPIFVYGKSGCDDSWIPCKSYSVWNLSDICPVQYGSILVTIHISDFVLADIIVKEREYDKDFIMNVTLNNGESLKNVSMYKGPDGIEKDYSYIVGILGFIDNGMAYTPIENLKQIKSL